MFDEPDQFSELDEYDLGISPIGMLLVGFAFAIGLIFFLNPYSELYDIQIGLIVIAGMTIGFGTGLQRWDNEGDLKKTFGWSLIGVALLSITVTIFYFDYSPILPAYSSAIQGSIFLVLILPAIFEELIFRVGLFNIFRRAAGVKGAVGIQALFFALYHFAREPDLRYLVVLFIGGLIFAVIYLITKNILTSMLAHAMFNLRPVMLSILLSPLMIVVVVIAVIAFIVRSRNG